MSRYAAVVLAAGLGSRYRASGGEAATKLVARLDGTALVRRVAEAAGAAGCDPVIVVTGHAQRDVEAALAGLPIRFVHNAEFASGLASSLRMGITNVPSDAAGAVVLLGDMPMVSAALIGSLIEQAEAIPAWDAVVPTVAGRRGNPVILGRPLFPKVGLLAGDAGARHLLKQPDVAVLEVPVGDPAAALDVDDAADLARAMDARQVRAKTGPS